MKKPLLLTLLGCSALLLSAAGNLRSTSTAQLKQLNDKGHALTDTRVVATAMEAPANAVEIPFTHNLGKSGSAEAANYTIIDANNDSRSWKVGTVSGYCACMLPNSDNIDAADDWLITVPIHFPAGNYTVSCEVGYMGSGATDVQMEIKLGTAPTIEGMTVEITPVTKYTEKNMTKYEYNCAIPAEGYYYLGFHNVTPKASKGTFKLNNVGVSSGSVTPPVEVDPPAAGTLTYVLAPKGELKATLTYTAPTKTKSGKDLESITKVQLTSRWTVDKYDFTDITPGQVITQEVPMYAGINNRFTAVAYVDDQAGEMVEIKNIYCGPDTPLTPRNVTLTVSDDYCHATLAWEAPGEVGENGGYVDTEALTYYVFDAFGSYYDPALVSTTNTSVTFDYTMLEAQDFMAYQVTAGNGELYSLDATSDIVTVGKPDAMPMGESFTNGFYDGYWIISPACNGSSYQNWGTVDDSYFASLIDPEDPDAPKPLTSQDGDNGFYYWLPYDKEAVFGLQSVRTDISSAANPVLDFWYQGKGSLIEALVAAGPNGSMNVAKSIDLKENPADAWTLARIPLTGYKTAGAVAFEIRLSAIHNTDDATWSVPFDNISIHDLKAHDLRLISLQAPGTVTPTQVIAPSVRIANSGTESATATVTLNANGTPVQTLTADNLEPNAITTLQFSYTVPVNAPEAIEFTLTALMGTETVTLANTAVAQVKRRNFAPVSDLKAEADEHRVKLSWSHPVNEAAAPQVITEDWEDESYPVMGINGAGGWTTYDGDGVKTYNIFRETYNPYQTAPIGFQLFNNIVAEVPSNYIDDAAAHSGNTFMMAPSAQGAANDNWLISPKLSGNAQTVTFYAKSYTVTWPESFTVRYSTTGNAVADFTAEATVTGLMADNVVPEVWTLITVTLPAGATHFAIVHDSYDSLALFVDDVTYEGESDIPQDLAITGYHILRDGKTILDTPVTGIEHVDTPITPEQLQSGLQHHFDYSIVAEYNHGFAAESAPAHVILDNSGIDNIAVDSIAPDATFYSIDGRIIPAANITPGYYIMRSNGTATKVLVK